MEKDNKIKNLISLSILLFGLLLGSLFVDIGQIIKGGGYSQKNLNKSDIFEASGKTWVAYSDPAVPISVITDDACENCDPGEILAWLRRVSPTISAEKINFDTEKGKTLIGEFGIKTLPAFIFGKNLDQTEFYAEAQPLFYAKGDKYVLNVQELGAPVGKYLELPRINNDDATFGNNDAKVKVVIFSDFQCPYCKVFYKSLRDTMKNYKDNVLFSFKEFPLSEIHPQAENAALASMCALEQGKFWEYADMLYAKQSQWGETKDTSSFKSYARTLGLNANDFNGCLDNKKYQDKINADKNEAQNFGVTGTPTIFIQDKVETGALSADQFKADIEEQLSKKQE
ncbi:MAG TPA: thioredoxin domain-containing protein [Candidatus Moranbacteria bacterium]|nr:thioredoxin domain-containing protein [Candidatus Moranbacteria bacterium]